MNRRQGHDDDGFTLTELLVVIVLFAIVGGIIAMATTTGLRNQRKVQDRNDALAQMRTAMQRVERDIRSTDGLGAAEGTSIVTSQTQASGTTYVTYELQADGTSYDLTVRSGSSPGAGTPKTLLTHVVNPDTTPVFTYSPTVGYAAPAGSGISDTDCSVAGSSPTAYAPSCIGVVTLHLVVQPPTLAQPIDLTDNGTEVRNSA